MKKKTASPEKVRQPFCLPGLRVLGSPKSLHGLVGSSLKLCGCDFQIVGITAVVIGGFIGIANHRQSGDDFKPYTGVEVLTAANVALVVVVTNVVFALSQTGAQLVIAA